MANNEKKLWREKTLCAVEETNAPVRLYRIIFHTGLTFAPVEK